jgi:archaellum component FlaC
MENKTQYTQSGTTGEIRATSPAQVTTKTSTDIKIEKLEEQIANQHQLIVKLRRDIGRLKNDISDIVAVLRNRG